MPVGVRMRQTQTWLDLAVVHGVMHVHPMINPAFAVLACRSRRRDGEDRRFPSVPRPVASSRGGRWWAALLALALVFTGCASAPAPVIENDLEAFTQGMDEILKVGMSIREARAALRERMPPASINTQVTAPVPSANRSMQMKRYMIGWPTLNHGTTLIVTIFCDRDGKIVRWTTGPFTDNK